MTMSEPFANNNEYLLAELRYLDCLIAAEIARMRQGETQHATATLLGTFISDQEADRLLNEGADSEAGAGCTRKAAALRHEIDERKGASLRADVLLPLPYLSALIRLSPFETCILLLALAPEVDLKYERLYAYLQDDLSRRRPTLSLVLRLLCDTAAQRMDARAAFSSDAPLFRTRVLRYQGAKEELGPARQMAIDGLIVSFLLDIEGSEPDFAACFQRLSARQPLEGLRWEAALTNGLLNLVGGYARGDLGDRRRLIVHFHGPQGTGRKTLAAALCAAIGAPLFVADVRELTRRFEDFEDAIHRVYRQALLNQAALYLENFDSLMDQEQGPNRRNALRTVIDELAWLTFIGSETAWSPGRLFHPHMYVNAELPVPDLAAREELWRRISGPAQRFAADLEWADLAVKFRLTPGAMEGALAAAESKALLRNSEGGRITAADLLCGCYAQSNRNLAKLARKLLPRYQWPDIVLPRNAVGQLREVCQQVRHRRTVYVSWGFEQKLSLSKGLSVLLYGQSGCGKTMAVEIISNELEMETYKIDLSTVVSKYIGETEKNLSRIFEEAESSNCILFFDEADALFGKRSEVKDAHDRYANIEISYLLQRMEEFEGLVVLATNLRKNIDDGFFRRMHFAIEFPFPDAGQRYRIWRQHVAPSAPLAGDIDFDYLAQRFPLAGGNIRNVVVNAAFLAAANGGEIHMEHMIRATRREYEKIGKVCTETEFAPYHSLLQEA
jgi:SpoVK/Ycf46/Vps4 family AAA+-type ATPase